MGVRSIRERHWEHARNTITNVVRPSHRTRLKRTNAFRSTRSKRVLSLCLEHVLSPFASHWATKFLSRRVPIIDQKLVYWLNSRLDRSCFYDFSTTLTLILLVLLLSYQRMIGSPLPGRELPHVSTATTRTINISSTGALTIRRYSSVLCNRCLWCRTSLVDLCLNGGLTRLRLPDNYLSLYTILTDPGIVTGTDPLHE